MESNVRPVAGLRRKRGGQPGNRNRWKHGRYSTETRRRDKALRALIRHCRETIALVARLPSIRSGLTPEKRE